MLFGSLAIDIDVSHRITHRVAMAETNLFRLAVNSLRRQVQVAGQRTCTQNVEAMTYWCISIVYATKLWARQKGELSAQVRHELMQGVYELHRILSTRLDTNQQCIGTSATAWCNWSCTTKIVQRPTPAEKEGTARRSTGCDQDWMKRLRCTQGILRQAVRNLIEIHASMNGRKDVLGRTLTAMAVQASNTYW